MRTLSAIVTALSLGACAAQPHITDIAAQIRSDFGSGKQGCADRSQPKCFTANPAPPSRPSVETAETHPKQRIVNAHPPLPKLDGPQETVTEGVPTLNSEASCHLVDFDQSVERCFSLESRARDQLAHKWTEFPSADRSHCMRYSSAGTYTDLLTCLEMEVDVRNLHAKSRSVANQ
jgi:hypothetical protein